jgi:hypothetical protein
MESIDADATAIKVFDDPQKVCGASRQPIRVGDDQRIASADELQSPLETITLSDGQNTG